MKSRQLTLVPLLAAALACSEATLGGEEKKTESKWEGSRDGMTDTFTALMDARRSLR